jgi:hypothetical protein
MLTKTVVDVEDGLGPPLDDILDGDDHPALLYGGHQPDVQQQGQELLLPAKNLNLNFPPFFFPPLIVFYVLISRYFSTFSFKISSPLLKKLYHRIFNVLIFSPKIFFSYFYFCPILHVHFKRYVKLLCRLF